MDKPKMNNYYRTKEETIRLFNYLDFFNFLMNLSSNDLEEKIDSEGNYAEKYIVIEERLAKYVYKLNVEDEKEFMNKYKFNMTYACVGNDNRLTHNAYESMLEILDYLPVDLELEKMFSNWLFLSHMGNSIDFMCEYYRIPRYMIIDFSKPEEFWNGLEHNEYLLNKHLMYQPKEVTLNITNILINNTKLDKKFSFFKQENEKQDSVLKMWTYLQDNYSISFLKLESFLSLFYDPRFLHDFELISNVLDTNEFKSMVESEQKLLIKVKINQMLDRAKNYIDSNLVSVSKMLEIS